MVSISIQAFHISFGTDIEEYKTLLDAVFGLFKTLLGDFDFEAIKLINPYLGPLLFITFEVVCYFVFLNMFLAILNKSYSDVLDKGVDDPMAVEFRATMSRYISRAQAIIFFWRRKDDLARFKEEEEEDEEEEGQKASENTLDGEALGIMLNTIQELSSTVRGLNDKIDNISRVQALTGASGKLQKLGGGGGGATHGQTVDQNSLSKNDSFVGSVDEAHSLIHGKEGSPPESPAIKGMDESSLGNDSVRAGPTLSTYGTDVAKKSVAPPPPLAVSGSVLPPGWEKHEDDEGKPYYHNTLNGTTQWDPPVVMTQPPPPPPGEQGGDLDDEMATPRL